MTHFPMTAHLYGSKAKGWTLTLTAGPRPVPTLNTLTVTGKREAKQLCKQYGWQAWNF